MLIQILTLTACMLIPIVAILQILNSDPATYFSTIALQLNGENNNNKTILDTTNTALDVQRITLPWKTPGNDL